RDDARFAVTGQRVSRQYSSRVYERDAHLSVSRFCSLGVEPHWVCLHPLRVRPGMAVSTRRERENPGQRAPSAPPRVGLPQGNTRITVAPDAVETCSAGGETIRSSSRRMARSSGSHWGARRYWRAPVLGFQSTKPVFGPATTSCPLGR